MNRSPSKITEMKSLNFYIILLSFLCQPLFSQQVKEKSYADIRKVYEKMNIDDIKAMPQVRLYIQKAKKEANGEKLIQGYRDGRQFDYGSKMKYADSAIAASITHGSTDDISSDYLSKGIIYYFYHKNYKAALDQYLKAYQFSKSTDNQYLRYKVLYHLGIVKVHLGYYEEALLHFTECIAYYGSKDKSGNHSNAEFNRKKAYLNCLHQLTVIHRYLRDFKTSDSLSRLGLRLTVGEPDFALEHSYFLKCSGISKYVNRDYEGAEKDLEKALPVIKKRNDFAWASVVFFYQGKVCEARGDSDGAVIFYNKIDSIYNAHSFILPEVFKSYNYLINHYRGKDVHKELYYTNQLLSADSLIAKDYAYLSSKIHQNFDRQSLIDERDRLSQSSRRKVGFWQVMILVTIILLAYFIVKYRQERQIKKKYDLLQKKLSSIAPDSPVISEECNVKQSVRKTALTDEKAEDIRKKLQKFEDEKQFRKKGLTQHILATKLETNSHYLSTYINETKGVNFNKYLAELRINYITHLLNTNNTYLQYTIEALAAECGIAARQNFSSLFYEINGIRPTDYIKNRKKELGIV